MLPKIKTTNADGTVTEANKPLELAIDADTITLDELCLFEEDGFTVTAFRQFLRDRSNWTKEEIGKLTKADLEEVMTTARAAAQETAIPLGNSPR